MAHISKTRFQKLSASVLALFGVLLSIAIEGCDTKREEPSIAPVKGTQQRIEGYQRSYFFDESILGFSSQLRKWNATLVALVETNGGGDKDKKAVLDTTFDQIIPLIKEAQRGFFKRENLQWRKEIKTIGRLSVDKEIFLEKLVVILDEDFGGSFKEPAWTIHAYGRYPKDQSGELFQLQWKPASRELIIESRQKSESPFKCSLTLKKSGTVDKGLCENMMVFRFENKDITITSLSYDSKKGFDGEGRISGAKGTTEKWEVHSNPPVPAPSPTAGVGFEK